MGKIERTESDIHIMDESAKNMSRSKKNTQEKFKAIQPTHHGIYVEPIVEQCKTSTTQSNSENSIVSLSFISALAGTMSWPLAAFGLLVDNALISGANKLKINYRIKSYMSSESKATKNPAEIKNLRENERGIFLQIDDDGLGWELHDFLKVVMNFDRDSQQDKRTQDENLKEVAGKSNKDVMKKKLNEFSLNLKIAGFRLGKTILYISRNGDEVSLAFISSDKRYNPNVHKNHIFYYAWKQSTGEFLTQYALRNKRIIFNAISGILSEQEILKDLDTLSNRVIILDLNSVVVNSSDNRITFDSELILKKSKGVDTFDVMVRTLDNTFNHFYDERTHSLLELSLKTYLNNLFLDSSKVKLIVFLNEVLINFDNIQNHTLDQSKIHQSFVIKENDLYEGSVFLNDLRQHSDLQLNKGLSNQESNETLDLNNENNEVECANLESLQPGRFYFFLLLKVYKGRVDQGILLYSQNRLIRRLESPVLGNLNFIVPHSVSSNKENNQLNKPNCMNGFIKLDRYFKPNMFKTVILK